MNPYACYPAPRTFRKMHRRQPNSYYRTGFPVSNGVNPYTRPAANIRREDNAFLIELAIPGMTRDQLQLEVKDQVLTVSSREQESTTTTKFTRKEFDYTNFRRSFRLHEHADNDAMTARLDQGVLTIRIPDRQVEKTKITIQ